MKGKYNLVISNSRVTYELELERNITVLKGNSGTGKSSFYRMVSAITSDPPAAGYHCNLKERLELLHNRDTHWQETIQNSHGKIFVADESTRYIYSKDFASLLEGNDNYFILISRRPFENIAYSVNCIHGL